MTLLIVVYPQPDEYLFRHTWFIFKLFLWIPSSLSS